jgi:hypothetical protein
MERKLIDRIARTVLYEGYVLYPYRPSSLKNSRRCAFGVLYPPRWIQGHRGSDRSGFRTEGLLRGTDETRVSVVVRFLQYEEPHAQRVLEREIGFDAVAGVLTGQAHLETFRFEGQVDVEGEIELRADAVQPGVYKLALKVRNTGDLDFGDADEAFRGSMISAHAVISTPDGSLVSITDPPGELSDIAATCVNEGVWPVLVGASGAADTILASPVILPDYPQLAPESPGDLFDATEIDEILTLRILTLTDSEKAEVRRSDEKARAILERAESLSADHLMNLHGVIRSMSPAAPEKWSAWDNEETLSPLTSICVGKGRVAVGDRVRLRPGKRADILDSALAGRIAIVAGIEEDFEKNIHLAVVVEDDPGKDLGKMRFVGHRFFFSLPEIEALEESGAPEELRS